MSQSDTDKTLAAEERSEETRSGVRRVRAATRRKYRPEEKIRIVLEGLRGEESIATRWRREGIAESLYYSWSKEFLEAGNTARQATSIEAKALLTEARNLKEALAEQMLEKLLLEKSMIGDGRDEA